ncbi:hypothetical protein [Flavobacterium hydatis]|uniref:Lipoprotein n=1 Tax=Flavobacterium hydatis TaxID=991 RepID=A0A086ARP1_FLAHY|nr:hypothetical protein [Flavobacterium hydatis]KFF19355.1 hypothetical protein IW20_02405 [Flavobacterium hydatis]OXA96511.1 hypothetical protein B0A62_04415 [Flavobacterium hydatis]
MKKSIINTLSYAVLGISLLTIVSCKDHKKEVKAAQNEAFTGTWVARQFIDSLITNNGIKTNSNGVTEIIIPQNLKDSITFLNEDLEKGKYAATIKNDTLVNHIGESKTQEAVLRSGKLILLPLDERYQEQKYIKVNNTLTDAAKKAGVSVVRILINQNKLFAHHTFSKPGSTNSDITFSGGKVSGLENFESYYININGDEANVEEITSIDFKTKDGNSKKMGIQFYDDKIELYDAILTTKPDEKPYYKKGKLLYSLNAIKTNI